MIIEGPEFDPDIIFTAGFDTVEDMLKTYEKIAEDMTPSVENFLLYWHRLLDEATMIHAYEGMVRSLIQMIMDDKRCDESRAPFHDLMPDGGYQVKPVVRYIGQWLDSLGGLGLMQAAHIKMQSYSSVDIGDGSSLEYAWKGIGTWQ